MLTTEVAVNFENFFEGVLAVNQVRLVFKKKFVKLRRLLFRKKFFFVKLRRLLFKKNFRESKVVS